MPTGDVYVNWKGKVNSVVGHAGMTGANGMWEARGGGVREDKDAYWGGARMWEPTGMSEDDRTALQGWMTKLIGVPYSVGRAICCIGSKKYGPAAEGKLKKYFDRDKEVHPGISWVR